MTRSVLLFGQLLDFLSDPGVSGLAEACRHVSDGALWIVDGHIVEHGPRQAVLERIPAALLASSTRYDYGQRFILPGLVDTHCHYP